MLLQIREERARQRSWQFSLKRLKFAVFAERPACMKQLEVLSCCTVYYAVQGGSNFKSVDKTIVCDHSNESYWAETVFLILHKGVLTLKSVKD